MSVGGGDDVLNFRVRLMLKLDEKRCLASLEGVGRVEADAGVW